MKLKSLKKASAVLLCAIIALTSAITVFAAGKDYYVPEVANMKITLPDDFSAVTRESDPNDKYFSLYGIDYNTCKQNFEKYNIYLQGMNGSADVTVTVTMQETEESKQIGSYAQLESDKLGEIARNFLSQNEYTACTVDQAVSNVVWLEFNTRVNDSGSLIQSYQANTVYDGKSVNVTLQRNGGNVTGGDYDVFSGIVESVEFNKSAIFSLSNPMLPYFLIGGGILLILIIVFIIIIVRVATRRRKKSKNDKILEELAGKYTSRSDRARGEADGRAYEDASGVQDNYYDLSNFGDTPVKPAESEQPVQQQAPGEGSGRHYSDEDIDAMLGEGGEPNFTQALPEETVEEPIKTEETEEAGEADDTIDNTDQVSEFFEDEPSQPEQEEISEATKKFDFPAKANKNDILAETVAEAVTAAAVVAAADEMEAEPEETEPETEAGPEETEPEETEPEAEAEPEILEAELVEFDTKEPEITEPAAEEPETPEEPEEETEEVTADEAEGSESEAEEGSAQPEPEEEPEAKTTLRDEIKRALAEFEEEDDEDEEFNNDEVLVREEARKTKFVESSDFFEEAPRRVIGVISSKDIQNAEEYDVIGEMERRADEVEKEPPQKGEALSNAVKNVGDGVKSFFTHCGYFATNVKREIKRKKAEEKRRQYEEDRRRRAKERAERQRQQAQNGGLVQVHKRTDRKPQPNRRPPSQQQRRPSNPQNRRGNPPRKR